MSDSHNTSSTDQSEAQFVSLYPPPPPPSFQQQLQKFDGKAAKQRAKV